ncbi:hypothetical protein PAXRUDRAFT_167530, partial [Paxillus rubicundulus Ve08.2h10]
SSAFQQSQVACSPESFFNENEWLWADSAYSSQTWCIVPFKKPTVGSLSHNQKRFNYHLSKVSIAHAGIHFYGSLKGRFQSLCELCFQIQSEDDLEYANAWVRSCLVLHNMIVKFEDELGLSTSTDEFAREYERMEERGHGGNEDPDGDEEPQGQPHAAQEGLPANQAVRNTLMAHIIHHIERGI